MFVAGLIMSEVQVLDKGLESLLQELSTDVTDDISTLLKDPYLYDEILKYLSNISSIESKEYLSAIPPTPSAESTTQDERTLIQDIAELEALQRSVDNELKNLIFESKDDIVKYQKELIESESLFQDRFVNGFKDLWRSFNEDDLADIENDEDQDISNLLELDGNTKKAKKNTLKSTLASIKENSNSYNQNKSLSTVLENMDQITNILELPSLTGACIKAGYYSEALEIASYTRRLAIKFPQSELIKKVEFGIQQEMSHMLNGLMRLLKTDLKQSSLIKTLSYLRRIPPFSQTDDSSNGQLKRILLHARFQSIKSELDSLQDFISDERFEKHLKRSIEVIREHCFSSIMIFKNVFPDVDPTELQDVIIELEEDEKEDEKEKEEEKKEQGEKEDKEEKDDKKESSEESKESEEVKEGVKEEAIEDITEPEAQETKQEGETEGGKEEDKEKNEPVEEQNEVEEEEDIQLISTESREQSNILLYEFVFNVVSILIIELQKSLPNIKESSTRDALYLQLIYCAQSLNRIDSNFSDLMTSLLLNAKSNNHFLINRKSWKTSLIKQIQLSKSLNK